MKLHRIIVGVTLLGALSACSGNRNSDFKCPPQGCVTLAQADAQVRTGVAPVTASSSGGAGRTATAAASGRAAAATPAGAPRSAIPSLGTRSEAAQFRQPEVVGTLWVAPYLDQGGLLHSEQSVMFVVTPARWVGAQ